MENGLVGKIEFGVEASTSAESLENGYLEIR